MNTINLVREFQERFGCETHNRPVFDTKLSLLRLSLLREELEELRLAVAEADRVGVLDALTDLQYVLDGAFLALGYPKGPTPRVVVTGAATLLLEKHIQGLAIGLMRCDRALVECSLIWLQVALDHAYSTQGFQEVRDAAFLEVHRSNMSKLGADGKPLHARDGKVVKGPNYSPPKLEAFV